MLEKVSYKIDNVLARDLIARGLYIQAKTLGPSMYPLIKTGYKILVKPASFSDISIGDVVLFQRGEYFIVHRIIKKNDPSMVITRGDNFIVFDPPVTPVDILGRVIRIENHQRQLQLTSWSSRFLGYLIASLGRAQFRGQVRVNRTLARLCWLLGGRPVK